MILRSITDEAIFVKAKGLDEDILSIKNQFSLGAKKGDPGIRSGDRNNTQWGRRSKGKYSHSIASNSPRPYQIIP